MATRYFVADFETTTPLNKAALEYFTETEVWGAGITEVGNDTEEDVALFGSIRDFLDYCKSIEGKCPLIYFHNLRFDGNFTTDYLLRHMHFKVAESPYKLNRNEFYPMISKDGIWYCIRINYQGKVFEFRDSLKILPFTVDQIAKQLKTKHQKLVGSIDYRADRKLVWESRGGKWFKHYEMNETEKKYLMNDILVMSEALQEMKKYGALDYLTIGAACMDDFKNRIRRDRYDKVFPELDIDDELRKAYHGGWCFVKNPGKEIHQHGYVYDVNSLYPYAMSSKDKHYYPFGHPHHFNGEDFEDYKNRCYFIKVRTNFRIKPGHLPFIQYKNFIFADNKYLEDTFDEYGDEHILDFTFTRPDFELFQEQYDILYLEIIEGWWFDYKIGIFDDYINYWYELKKNAPTKCDRLWCKLMLNNLYGKTATNPISWSSIPYLDESDEMIHMNYKKEHRKGGYIAVGAYITSWARCTTIRAAQANYDNFEYADTDSIHLTAPAKDIKVGKELGEWKLETEFSDAKFVRQKTYIEKTIKEDGEDVEPYWNIKACGCPDECKERLLFKVDLFEPLTKDTNGVIINSRRTDEEFMKRFDIGLVESGKLQQTRIKGGIVLTDNTFRIKPV